MPHRLALVLTACTVCACTSEALVLDGGAGDGAIVPIGLLTLESEPSLALAFDEEAPITIRYTENGEPVPDERIRYALEGSAHDATVTDLAISTDADGRTRTTAVAGSTIAVFRVRVSADRADPIYVNVSVGNMGFGTLVADAPYAGNRDGIAHRLVEVYSGIDCSDDPPSADRVAVLDDPAVTDARFGSLPVGPSYTIIARVIGIAGATLARGCVDGVAITRDGETRVELTFTDEALMPSGSYDAELVLAPAETSAMITEAASTAGITRIDAAGSGAGLYLDALIAELRARGASAEADALAADRIAFGYDADLAASLDAAGAGPGVALLGLASDLRARLSSLAIGGPLTISENGPGLSARWDTARIEMGATGDPDSVPLVFSPMSYGLSLSPSLSVSWQADTDTLGLDDVALDLPIGSLLVTALEEEAALRGVSSLGELLLDGAGCETLSTWATTTISSCSAECAQAACVRALDFVMSAVVGTLPTFDGARDRITVSGSAEAIDSDGDLYVDRIMGVGLSGFWSAIGQTGDALSGDFTAARDR